MDGSDALQAGQVAPSVAPKQGPGAQLATQRQALGWSIEHVANQLNLAPRQIQALENDDYAALPGLVIARGFVRAYAKLLKIDATALVAYMAQQPASNVASGEMRRALPASFTESKLQTNSRGSRLILLVGLVAVTIGIAGWFGYQQNWFAGLPELIQAQGEKSTSPLSSQISAPQVDANVADHVEENTSGEMQTGEAPEEPVVTPAEISTAVTQNAASQASSATAEEKSINPAHNLILKVREESWVEVKREDGTTIVARLMPAGSTESFAVKQPALLVVGNATGVDATFRGKPLDLTTAAKSNVARLNLQ